MKNIGKKLYNFTNNIGKFLINNKCVFYILSFTWGIMMTFLGLLILLIFLPFKKVKVYKKRLYVPVGEFWGGITLGIIFFIEKSEPERIKSHEFGHTIQNAIFGPLFLILIGLPSLIRATYREFKYYRKGRQPKTLYDDIWFEGSATSLGEYANGVR